MSEDIVITGISGRFPESDDTEELWHNLTNHKDMITESSNRWPNKGLPGLPDRIGKIKCLSKFDAQYFGYSDEHANLQDPLMRLLHEVVFEAIVDSGNDPNKLKGKNVGVFVANDEIERSFVMLKNETIARSREHSLNGTYRTLLANSISFYYDFKGPSIVMCTGCSGAGTALNQAFVYLKQNICDSALVAGCHTSLNPLYGLTANSRRWLSADGKSKFMDESADGYPLSEICCALYIESKSNAKRIYATILNSHITHDGHKPKRYAPSRSAVSAAIDDTIKRANINKQSINYVECHGSGTRLGDLAEIGAITDSLCNERTSPVLVGSVKTNLGHAKAGAAISSIAKVLLSFEHDTIPASLHLNKVAAEFEHLVKNKVIEHVGANRPCAPGPVLVISFGYGGSNAFTLLEKNEIVGGNDLLGESVIIPLFARTEQGIIKQISKIKHYIDKSKVNMDFISLYYEIVSLKNMPYRGYMLLDLGDNCETGNLQTFHELTPNSRNKLAFNFLDSANIFSHDENYLGKLINLAIDLRIFIGKNAQMLTGLIDKSSWISKEIIASMMMVNLLLAFGVTPDHCMADTFAGILMTALINRDITEENIINIAIELSRSVDQKHHADFDFENWLGECFPKTYWAEKLIDSYLGKVNKKKYDNDTIIINFTRTKSGVFEHDDNCTQLYTFKDNNVFKNLIELLGQLYSKGVDINWSLLHPTRGRFPVSRGTQSIAPLIQWDHSTEYYVPQYDEFI